MGPPRGPVCARRIRCLALRTPARMGRHLACRKATVLKLTIDSSEPLEDAMRVLGALYGVTLVVSSDDRAASKPATKSRSGSAKNEGRARRKSPGTRKTRPAAPTVGGVVAQSKQETARRSAGSPRNAEVRAWARQNGLTVSDRGRVAAPVMTAYREAHNL